MQLTLFSDYALRTLLYLALHPEETVPASAISDAFGSSSDHIAKVAKWLTQQGYVSATRGKGGGLRLSRDPKAIRVGELIRKTEPHLDVVECFSRATNTCPLTRACKLKEVFYEARSAFLAVLDDYTLADLSENRVQLVPLLIARR